MEKFKCPKCKSVVTQTDEGAWDLFLKLKKEMEE